MSVTPKVNCPLCKAADTLVQIGSSDNYFCTSCRSIVENAVYRLADEAIETLCDRLRKLGASFRVVSPGGTVFLEDTRRAGGPGRLDSPRVLKQHGRKASERSKNVLFWREIGLTEQVRAIKPDTVALLSRPKEAEAGAFRDAVQRRCYEYFGNNYTAALTPDKKHVEVMVGPNPKPYVRGQRERPNRSAIWTRENFPERLSGMSKGTSRFIACPPEMDILTFQKYISKVLMDLYGRRNYRTSAMRDGSGLTVWRI